MRYLRSHHTYSNIRTAAAIWQGTPENKTSGRQVVYNPEGYPVLVRVLESRGRPKISVVSGRRRALSARLGAIPAIRCRMPELRGRYDINTLEVANVGTVRTYGDGMRVEFMLVTAEPPRNSARVG
jgi:hypothetical protein